MIFTDMHVNIISIFLSTLVSIFVAVFLLDHLKTSAKDLCNSVAEEIKALAYLPKSIKNYRVLRFCYMSSVLCVSSVIHVVIRPASSLFDIFVYFVISALLIPIGLLCFYVVFSLVLELLAFVIDLIEYFVWVPYKLYKERNSPSLSQLMMLWGWFLFFAIWGIIVFHLFHLVLTM